MLPSFIKENECPIYVKQEMVFDIPRKYEKYTHYDVVRDIFSICCDNKISRSIVTEIFKSKCMYTGFFASMIWGGVSSCGDKQDNLSKMLEYPKDQLIAIIEHVNILLSEGKVQDAFIFMETKGQGKIDGLGESYFTKLFFFLCKANDYPKVTPIFDKWTKLAYCAFLLDLGENDEFQRVVQSINGPEVKFKASYRVKVYDDFVCKMNLWANEISVSVSSLEEFIFGVDKRIDRTWSNPRRIFEKKVNTYLLQHRVCI
ncbi:8-oxoguanine DNA glycosylase OGG fold protein [Photobacterium sp. J15]|uniref:8-oxoguanine DNA glycosylase OGG fold protein n=1 Tax=Photobacterium sp. J15 TaxID=265901 RepID=UPI0007E3713D|nr:hypothetical protein [Photobacterium sp. J15]